MTTYPYIINHSSEDMREVDSLSVDFVLTSPPYNLNTPYSDYSDAKKMDAYVALISSVVKECSRVVKDDGLIAFNVPEFVRINGEIYFYPKIYEEIFRRNQMERFSLAFWVKIDGNDLLNPSHKWGENSRAIAPDLHSVTEWIMVFQKKSMNRRAGSGNDEIIYLQRNSCKDEHPAAWPEDLAVHLIKKFTSEQQVVLDPFMGIGTTALACQILTRKFIGYEISSEYCRISERHLRSRQFMSAKLEQ